MGINGLQANEPAFSFFRSPALPSAAELLTSAPHAQSSAPPEGGDAVNLSSEARNLFFEQQIRFAAQQSQFLAQSTGDDGEVQSTQLSAQQLEFSFVSETRYSEIQRFTERTANTAGQLQEPQQTRYTELSQSVSARFEFSFSFSAASLDGFAGAGEDLVDSEALFDKFLELSQELLDRANGLFEDFFSLFGGGDVIEGGLAIGDRFNELIAEFLREFGGGEAGPVAGNGQSGTGAQASFTQLEFKFSFEGSISITQVQQADPIILDLDGDGFELTDHRDGARFDLLANGSQQNTAFVTGGDAFLAIDRNGDGQINDGTELFGEQRGATNGFEELRKLDSNRDGIIDAKDEGFDSLLLFKDNGNGQTEAGELISLRDAGIRSIDLNYADVNQRAAGGNRITQIASFTRDDGSRGRSADALLNLTV